MANESTSSEFQTHWCPLCEGVSHPATGCVYTPTFIVCWACTRAACTWVQNWTNSKGRRGGGPSFYDHVASPVAASA